MSGPLAGIRVIDLTRILAGPWCTQILGDLGADIIKIEHPETGDDTRQWGPPWLKDKEGRDTAESSYYLSANRNKYSVALDIKQQAGRELLRSLIGKSDILIENFKVGGLKRYGLDYPSLEKTNPRLIYLSITGFGQTGPMASQPGYDYLIQGLGGLMSITGLPDDQPGGGPQRVGVAITDITTGLYATIGILSALQHRHNTGEGQYIDLALLDTMVGWLANQASSYLTGGTLPQRTGNWHPNLAPYQPFRSSDGSFILAVGNDSQFANLCNFLGIPELVEDVRFRTNPNRNKNRAALEQVLQQSFGRKSSAYWVEQLPEQGIPASAINDIGETFSMPQIQERGMQIEMEHPLSGKIAGVANPLNFSRSEIAYRNAAPLHGADTENILSAVLGIDPGEIENLRQNGVIKA
ncbi:MAG: CoA transferase [Gammaproteobacteria bacterium]|nr:CoA transferase [Gammaproteobacteria bacterium]